MTPGTPAPAPTTQASQPAPVAPETDLLPPALEGFAAALASEPSARVPLERCRSLLHTLPGGAPTTEPDPRRGLSTILETLARAGRVRLPSPRSKTGWDRERQPALPLVVLVPRRPRLPRTDLPAALHPLLAHARDRAVGVRLPDDLTAIDAWLKAHGSTAPDLPVAERSYEIFGDEKRLDAFLRTRFALQGGLTPPSLRAYRVVEPFAMTAFDPTSDWAIAIENLATYDSTCRAVLALPPASLRPAAVIFGRGTQFTLSCASFPGRLPTVRRVLYFGDLDATGLEIALSAQATLSELGVTLSPWTAAYARMLEHSAAHVSKLPRSSDVPRIIRFLPATQQERARHVMSAGRVAQESVGRLELEALLMGESGQGPR